MQPILYPLPHNSIKTVVILSYLNVQRPKFPVLYKPIRRTTKVQKPKSIKYLPIFFIPFVPIFPKNSDVINN